LLCSLGVRSQSIIAGQHSASDYYASPDTVIYCNWGSTGTSIEWAIDMNNDGINDFTFIANNGGGALGGTDASVQITAASNNQIAFGAVDSCFIPTGAPCGDSGFVFANQITRVFADNDTINKAVTWNNVAQYLYFYSSFNGCYACSGTASGDSMYIIATRVLKGYDTLYGWIRVKDVFANDGDAGLTVIDYACNKKSAYGVITFDNGSSFRVFPNPCKDIVSVQLSSSVKQCELSISDLNGQEVIRQEIKSNEAQINISSLTSGVYFIKLMNDKDVEVRKIIVE